MGEHHGKGGVEYPVGVKVNDGRARQCVDTLVHFLDRYPISLIDTQPRFAFCRIRLDFLLDFLIAILILLCVCTHVEHAASYLSFLSYPTSMTNEMTPILHTFFLVIGYW